MRLVTDDLRKRALKLVLKAGYHAEFSGDCILAYRGPGRREGLRYVDVLGVIESDNPTAYVHGCYTGVML